MLEQINGVDWVLCAAGQSPEHHWHRMRRIDSLQIPARLTRADEVKVGDWVIGRSRGDLVDAPKLVIISEHPDEGKWTIPTSWHLAWDYETNSSGGLRCLARERVHVAKDPARVAELMAAATWTEVRWPRTVVSA